MESLHAQTVLWSEVIGDCPDVFVLLKRKISIEDEYHAYNLSFTVLECKLFFILIFADLKSIDI